MVCAPLGLMVNSLHFVKAGLCKPALTGACPPFDPCEIGTGKETLVIIYHISTGNS